MPQPLMMPNMNYLDLVEVLETRNINFNKPFTQDFCDEVVDVLDKVITYDKLMNYKDDEKYIRITLSTPGGSIFALFEVLDKIDNRYYLVGTVAKRAREIIDGAETYVTTKNRDNNKPVTIATQEVADDKITYRILTQEEIDRKEEVIIEEHISEEE